MNICFVSFDYPSDTGGGGVGNQVQLLARSLVRAGHCVSVVALTRPGLPDFSNDEGVDVHRIQVGNWHWYIGKLPVLREFLVLVIRELEYAWSAYCKVRQLHKQKSFDLIEGTETGGLWIALLLRDVPLVIRLHGERYTFHKYTPSLPMTLGLVFSRLLQRIAIRRAQMLISPSLAHANEIDSELAGRHPPVSVIPNFIDKALFINSDKRSGGDKLILYTGRIEKVKGVSVLLEAAGYVVQKCPDVYFVLAGAPHPNLSINQIHDWLATHGMREKIQLPGHVAWEDLLLLYQQAAVCILPSYYETFGVFALEAMAMGVPVVVTNVGGLPELVQNEITGLLISPGNSQELADAIINLLKDPVARNSLGERAKERAREYFDVVLATERNLAVYSRIIKR